MLILALDISTSTGWAVFDTESAQPVDFGVALHPLIPDTPYPRSFLWTMEHHRQWIRSMVDAPKDSLNVWAFDKIVIEETNKTGRFGSRHSQKLLEFLHAATLLGLQDANFPLDRVYYVNTSDWRKKLKLSVAETKKAAKPILRSFKALQKSLQEEKDRTKKRVLKAEVERIKRELKHRCIHGKIDKKSISVAFANATWNLSLKKGDNDIADALCLGEAFKRGVHTLTNDDIFGGGNKANELDKSK